MIKRILCLLGKCWNCRTRDDDNGIWGECVDCGKRHGYMSREEIRMAMESAQGRG